MTAPALDLPVDTSADAATRDALLRCWTRETGTEVPPSGELTLPLRRLGVTLTVPVAYRSATGCHRFGPVRPADGSIPVDAVTLAALLARESAGDGPAEPVADLVGRVADSVRRIGAYLTARREGTAAAPSDGFLAAEQNLLLGHLLHPAAKSRDGLPDAEDRDYAPELRGSFPLHWFSVHPSVVVRDGVPGHPATELMRAMSTLEDGRVAVPAHPWQAADLPRRGDFAALMSAGLVRHIGPDGPPWFPTSSLRTVYRPDMPAMLKLSLGLRITNSRRENTLTELRRGVEVHRLLDSGFADHVFAAYPGFRIVRDPAFIGVLSGGVPIGLDVSVREVPDGLTGARCVAGLAAPAPGIAAAPVVTLVTDLAAATGRPAAAVAVEWMRRYTDRVLAPMVHLYATTGIGLEAHQQNTLVLLDDAGWPAAGWYRDNQGYYLAAERLPGVEAALGRPGSTLAVTPGSIVDDRLTYYLLFNQAFAAVAALGNAGVADEDTLLRALSDGLAALVDRGHDGGHTGGLAARWLSADTLPCKANLATRMAGIDEVLAPVDNQSVYLDVPNPLRRAAA